MHKYFLLLAILCCLSMINFNAKAQSKAGKQPKNTEHIDDWISRGYITAKPSENLEDHLNNLGPKFSYFILEHSEDSFLQKDIILPKNWDVFKKNSLDSLLNSGHPFAQMEIQSLIPKNDSLYIYYTIKANSREVIDTIEIQGSFEVENHFLYKLIQFNPGETYKHEKISRAYRKVQQLPFAKWTAEPFFNFTLAQNKWILPIDKERASSIDGILGIHSGEASSQTRIKITADIAMHLWNILKQGEELVFNYKNLEASSPQLHFKAHLPYLANLDFGPEIAFDLNFKDSAYYQQKLQIGIRYYLSYQNFIRFGYYQENSQIIQANLQNFEYLQSIPEINNYSNRGIVLGFESQNKDDFHVARKGWAIKSNVQLLNKNIEAHSAYLEEAEKYNIPLKEWYAEEQAANTYFWQAQMEASLYIPFSKNINLAQSLSVAHKNLKNTSLNALYRIGGQSLLRGFNELQFYTKSYGVYTIEPRLFLNQRSYFFLFSDNAWLHRKSGSNFRSEIVWGLGAGMSFYTNTGIFSLAFGAGKEYQDAFNLRKIQVHIGYKALF